MREPSVIINGLSELVRQVLPLMVVVGVIHLEPEKLAGWVSIISFVLAFVSTFILRQSVTPIETANQQIQVAVNSPKGTTVSEVVKAQEEGLNAVQ